MISNSTLTVIPDAPISAFTRVFDALWARSGIQKQAQCSHLDSGFAASAYALPRFGGLKPAVAHEASEGGSLRPGMTTAS
jgi:hypothetical protein